MLYAFDLFGVFVFAVSGALVAARKQLDWLGALVLAAVTAVGGGTLRDLLLARHPLVWFSDAHYLLTIALAVAATWVWGRQRPVPKRALLVADAAGLSLFTVVGTQVALTQGQGAVIAVLLGITTGAAGGAIRDVLCAEVPLVLRQEIYATAAAAGGLLFVLLTGLGLPAAAAALVAMAAVFALRLAAIYRDWHLPRYRLRAEGE
ncbi:trimeric intracellular cation channel family protein [Plasticicumulans sp.]|uniref:trimeric intracellular cation channel family protein n=1 Tax=Plasticicumulans sp. TaxID=2307179 RepID=UPI002BCEA2DE|nr:trimeric intracellular cation channel family protein [Pseudomonadota bacterium]HNB89895.1 trimeric intracellular cation channel family protein [Plasticicumulans sp.]HNE01088.1 trimeric intracellular cation channel family protein [Plasticicumulans sp.]HNF67220.1 trimeric intracellular cation channel family protein [Plasticicumulans sp.]